MFEAIASQRRGIAVVEARDGHCTVCNVRLRPQMLNQILRNTELIQCEQLYADLSIATRTACASQASGTRTRRNDIERVSVAYIDGGARGNPGPAGYGVRIEKADRRA